MVKSSPSNAIQKAIHFVKLRFIISRAHYLRKDNYQQGKIEFKKSSVKEKQKRLRRGGKVTENYTKMVLITWITMMV